MITLYNSFPWPLFLLLAFGFGFYLLQYYLRNFFKHTAISAIGMILIGSTSFLIGILKINTEFQLNISEKYIREFIVFLLPIGITLTIIGAFIYNKGNGQRTKMLILCSTIIIAFFIYLLLLLKFY